MRLIISAFVLGGVIAAATPAQAIQLKGGNLLVGKVDNADEEGLSFLRNDGGQLDLRWSDLSQRSAQRIKTLFNLASDDQSEVLVTADSITYESAGGQREEVVGRVVGETDTEIKVRRQGLDFPIPRALIKRRTTVEVPVTDIYTIEQFYNEKLAELAPGDDADKHILLADLLVRVRDYEHAAEHLEKADELGGGRQKATLKDRIARLKLFSEARAERDLLDAIRTDMARKEFAKGLAKVEEFEQKYSDGKLAGDFARTKRTFMKARERHLINRITERWYKLTWTLARSAAVKAELGFDGARDYAEGEMGKEIRVRVARSLGLDQEEVENLWEKRFEHRGGPRAEQYNYGVGSWLLGSEAIMRNTAQGKSENDSKATKSKKDREMERIIQRIRKAQERARRAAARRGSGAKGKEQEMTPEKWWDDAPPNERTGWLRAYYAENGGDLKVEGAYLDTCVRCGGKGSLTVFQDTGETKQEKCSTCQGTRFKRYFRAR